MSHTIGDPQELAALYASGAMPPEQATEFEAHLDEGCATCAEAVRSYEGVVEALFAGLKPVEPSSAVRQQLMKKLDSRPAARAAAHDDHVPHTHVWRDWSGDGDEENVIVRAAAKDQGGWEETGVPGVRVRRLFVDRERNQMTALIRMAPGTAWPGHEHDGAEECLVLEGDLKAGDEIFYAGDYQRMARGSHHGVQSTTNGCLLLIVSSLTDKAA